MSILELADQLDEEACDALILGENETEEVELDCNREAAQKLRDLHSIISSCITYLEALVDNTKQMPTAQQARELIARAKEAL